MLLTMSICVSRIISRRAFVVATVMLAILGGSAYAYDTDRASTLVGREDGYTKVGDRVTSYVNKVGPWRNPSETYRYYDLPFCRPDVIEYQAADLGTVLRGDRLATSPFIVDFRVNEKWVDVCEQQLSARDVARLRLAVIEGYYFELVIDDMPLVGAVGMVEYDNDQNGGDAFGAFNEASPAVGTPKVYVFTHYDFELSYNENHVISANVTVSTQHRRDISHPDVFQTVENGENDGSADEASQPKFPIKFSYSVRWSQTPIPFKDRVAEMSSHSFQAQHIHISWLSIVNSMVLVLLLVGFLAVILMRVLNKDIAALSMLGDVEDSEELMGMDDDGELGWKQISGDVFRLPPHSSILCAMLGCGAQLLTVMFLLVFLSTVGVFYGKSGRGRWAYFAFMGLFAFTAEVAGFVSASFYKKIGGEKWVWNIFATSAMFVLPFFAMAFYLNFIAVGYNSTQAIPFGHIMRVVAMWMFVSVPLTVLGGIGGRHLSGKWDPPCRHNIIPREIPILPWYRRGPVQLFIAGCLPFSGIYIELYHIFSSVWGYRLYSLYGILLVVFLELMLVVAFTTVALTYFQLAVEDYRWWWRSFLSGGASAICLFAYCIYYYFHRTSMYGFMQTSFFFGYMFIVCYAYALALGTVGFVSSYAFVFYIYKAIKRD